MTLPTGTISLSDVNVELIKSATATISLNDADVRALAAVPSGLIDLQDLQGKSAVFAYTITTNQTDLNLRTLALANGWNGVYPAQITVGSGVSINGSVAANSTPALTIDGSWPNGVTLINNGSILGRGGNGGNGASSPTAGTAGGRALQVSVAASVDNVGTIAGGGGGGGGGRSSSGFSSNCDMGESSCSGSTGGGGGGGGGRSSVGLNASGGAAGSSFGCTSQTNASAGQAGTSTAPGNGGSGGFGGGCVCPNCNSGLGGTGGAGGAYGTAGNTGGGTSGGAGGAAGQAVNGNSNITWVAFGTRLGTIV